MARNTSILLDDYFENFINELKTGENSPKIRNFDRNKNLEKLKANFHINSTQPITTYNTPKREQLS